MIPVIEFYDQWPSVSLSERVEISFCERMGGGGGRMTKFYY